MRRLPLEQAEEKYRIIELQNGKIATLYEFGYAKVAEVSLDEETMVFKYWVPCPVCDNKNRGFSYDGQYFMNTQITCSHCGVYYRPVKKRKN